VTALGELGAATSARVVDRSTDALTCTMLALLCQGRPGGVAGHGDVNGDGLADVLLHFDSLWQDVLVVHLGARAPALDYPPVEAWVGERLGASATPCAVPAVRGAAPVSFVLTAPLPAGLGLDRATGRVCGTPRRPVSRRAYGITTEGPGAASGVLTLLVRPRDRVAPRVQVLPGRVTTGAGTSTGNVTVVCAPPERTCRVRGLRVNQAGTGRPVRARVDPTVDPRELGATLLLDVPRSMIATIPLRFVIRATVLDAVGNRTPVRRTVTLPLCFPPDEEPAFGDEPRTDCYA
jgi:hypothetical protein